MTWYGELRARLMQEKEAVGVARLAEQTGISAEMLYAVFAGRRDFGKDTLELLRQTRPDLVQDVFGQSGHTEKAEMTPADWARSCP